jgi:hypothetical protein
MEHFAPPAGPDRETRIIDYVLASSVVAIGVLSAIMSLVMRAQGI